MQTIIRTAAPVLIACLLVLAGCGSKEAPEANQPSSQNESAQNAVVQPSGTVDPDQEEHRIVSTTVAVTEILDALEIDLVGKPTSYKDLPKRYDTVKEVGNPMSPDMEIVKSLKPTDVLSVTTLQYDLEPVFDGIEIDATFLDLTSLDKMKEEIAALGQRFGREAQAEEIISRFDNKVDELKELVKDEEKPTVLILMGIPGSYLVATENSYIGDLVKQVGGINVVKDSKVEFLSSNTEFLHQSNPDVILRAVHGMPDEVIKMFDEEFKKNDIWKHFNAVKNGRVYDLEEELFGTTGNLAADKALEQLAKMLYPGTRG